MLPGHGGRTAGPGDAARLRAYISELIELAGEAVRSGRSADELASAAIPPAYGDWQVWGMFDRNLRFLHQYLSPSPDRL